MAASWPRLRTRYRLSAYALLAGACVVSPRAALAAPVVGFLLPIAVALLSASMRGKVRLLLVAGTAPGETLRRSPVHPAGPPIATSHPAAAGLLLTAGLAARQWVAANKPWLYNQFLYTTLGGYPRLGEDAPLLTRLWRAVLGFEPRVGFGYSMGRMNEAAIGAIVAIFALAAFETAAALSVWMLYIQDGAPLGAELEEGGPGRR